MTPALTAIDKALALRSAPLFCDVPADDLLPVGAHSTVVELEHGEILFGAGELGDALYVILDGAVDVIAEDGGAIARLGAGECVGEMAALDWEPRSATVAGAPRARLLRVDRNDLFDLLADHPALVSRLAVVLADRIRKAGAADAEP